jgi:hypothetical protein
MLIWQVLFVLPPVVHQLCLTLSFAAMGASQEFRWHAAAPAPLLLLPRWSADSNIWLGTATS